MNPADLIDELAAALRDVIQETPEEALEEDAEDVYKQLARRLIMRLAPDVLRQIRLLAQKEPN